MYFHNLLVSLDQFLNTLFGGYPDETLSARSYRCQSKLRWKISMNIINALFFDKNHCKEAIELEIDLPQQEYGESWDNKYNKHINK